MTWDQYEERFRREATLLGLSKVDQSLSEAKNLFERGLPVLFSANHVRLALGSAPDKFTALLEKPHEFYFQFDVPKRAGGFRTIHQPVDTLAAIQRWILQNILEKLPIHSKAMAFRRDHSIRMNAGLHANKAWVLSVDLVDFFGSVRPSRIQAVFANAGYRAEVARALAGLCCLARSLPQGAPTSPALSNLVFTALDETIEHLASAKGFEYSRYADDLCFSGIAVPTAILGPLRRLLHDSGFRLSESKTRLMPSYRQQKVTGLVVNAGPRVPRSVRRRLRQELYYIQQFGLAVHEQRIGALRTNRSDHLRGMAEFIRSVSPGDPVVKLADQVLGRFRSVRLP